MACKNPVRAGRVWLPSPDASSRRAAPELSRSGQSLDETSGCETGLIEDDRPALRDMLRSSNYQLALVSREDDPSTRTAKRFSGSLPAVFLPLKWKELVARVCEFVRDTRLPAETKLLWLGDACVDLINRNARRSTGELITLTNQEFKTLKCFLLNPGRPLSREELLNQAWGYENYPTTRTVDNHVLRLRQKFETHPARPIHFVTIHGFGYKFIP